MKNNTKKQKKKDNTETKKKNKQKRCAFSLSSSLMTLHGLTSKIEAGACYAPPLLDLTSSIASLIYGPKMKYKYVR